MILTIGNTKEERGKLVSSSGGRRRVEVDGLELIPIEHCIRFLYDKGKA